MQKATQKFLPFGCPPEVGRMSLRSAPLTVVVHVWGVGSGETPATHLSRCSRIGSGWQKCFLDGGAFPARPPSPPFSVVLSCLLSDCSFSCPRKGSNAMPAWTLQVIPATLLRVFITLAVIRCWFIYCLSPGTEGPCLFLHYCISGAKCSAWHAAGCLRFFAE